MEKLDFAKIGENVYLRYRHKLASSLVLGENADLDYTVARILGFTMGFSEEQIEAHRQEEAKTIKGIEGVIRAMGRKQKRDKERRNHHDGV